MRVSNVSRLAAAVLVALAATSVSGRAFAATGDYAVAGQWKLGGPGGWDCLVADPAAKRLYVTRGDRVVVVDTESGKSVGEIPHTYGVHGVALAHEFGRGYTSNGKTNSVTVFDLKTLKTLKEIKIDGQNPDLILYDASTKQVFVFNGRSADASVIDAKSGKVTAAIALGGKPEFAVSDEHGRVFVNIEDKAELAAIDAKSRKVDGDVAAGNVRGADRTGHRRCAPSSLFRVLPNEQHGRHRRDERPPGRQRADRQRTRRRCVRRAARLRVHLERSGRHVDGRPRGRSGSFQRRADTARRRRARERWRSIRRRTGSFFRRPNSARRRRRRPSNRSRARRW